MSKILLFSRCGLRVSRVMCLAAAVGILFSGCTNKKRGAEKLGAPSPEEVVRAFIELSAGASDPKDKEKLQALCHGEMKAAFEKMTDEAFRLAYMTTKVKLHQFKIIESSTQGMLSRIHYQVAVENPSGTDATKELNEREIELSLIDGLWKVDNVRLKGSDKIAFTRGMIF